MAKSKLDSVQPTSTKPDFILPDLAITYLSVDAIKQNPTRVRKHSASKIQRLSAFMTASRFIMPLIVDKAGTLYAGHARLEAARFLSLKTVPVIQLEHMTADMMRAYAVADNQYTLNAGWDKKSLRQELLYLEPVLAEFDLTLCDLGFEVAEIDLVIGDVVLPGDPDAEIVPETNRPAVTQLGDVWQLGPHRLVCGDSCNASTYDLLMRGEQADYVITDPPYNVRIDGHVGNSGAIKHREFAMASGEMSADEFIQFLYNALKPVTAVSKDGAIIVVFMDWRHMAELLAAATKSELSLINLCVWVKDNGGMGSLYRSQHELAFVFKHGHAPHTNAVQLGKHGRYRTNVWEYPGVNSFGGGRMQELAMHPTVKPVAMLADAMKDCSARNDIVLDPFGGSGSTLIAAEQTGRVARLIELDPQYCDVIIKRWQSQTGQDAIHVESGDRFAVRDLILKQTAQMAEGA